MDIILHLMMKLFPKKFERALPFEKVMLWLMILSAVVFCVAAVGLSMKATRREDFHSKQGLVESCFLKEQSDVSEHYVVKYKIMELRLQQDPNLYRSWFRLDESDTTSIDVGKSVSLTLKHEKPVHNHLSFYAIEFDGRKLGSVEEVLTGEKVAKTIGFIMLMVSGAVFYQCRKSRIKHLEKGKVEHGRV